MTLPSRPGGTTLSLYDGDSHAGTLQTVNLTAARTYTLPNESGTLCTSGSVCAGYQATLGFTAVPTTRTLTLVGTANQITVTPAGAQDLAANRTSTLALPQNIDLAALARFGSLGLGVAAPGSPGVLAQTAPTNAVTMQTLKRATDTPPFTGAFVDYQTAAGTSLWKVDMTGRLVAGTVPGTTYLNVKDPPYNATGDGVTDDTAAIQAALNASFGSIYIPPGIYVVTQLTVPLGVSIHGAGMGAPPNAGTQLLQPNGVNLSMIIGSACTGSPTNYWHWSRIQDLNLRKAAGSTDTLGSAIDVLCRSGEGLRFEHLLIVGWPEAGIRYRRGGQPLIINDIHLFGNQQYGLLVGRTGSDIWQTVSLQGISGDNNTIALIGLNAGGAATDSFHLSDIKAESLTGTPQPTVVEMVGLSNAPVYVENLSAIGVGTTIAEIFKISGSGVRLYMQGVKCSACTNLINDTVSAVLVPYTSPTRYWATYSANLLGTNDVIGISTGSMYLGRSLAVLNDVVGLGLLTQQADANNVTLHTLKRKTDTAPTGAFTTYQSAAGASLWNVDIGGTLTAGIVPGARVSGNIAGQAVGLTDGDKGDFTCTAGTCTLDAAAPGGDVTTATSLATSHYVGDGTVGQCTWSEAGTVIEAACDVDKTTLATSDILMFASGPMHLVNADGDSCATTNNLTGLTTYHTTNACQRPSISRPFDAMAFNVGAGVTIETVSLNGWPGVPVLDGPDSDAGTFSLTVPVLWRDFADAGEMTLQLACHSIAAQSGLTLIVRVGAAVCTATGAVLPGFVAPTSGPQLTCTFGASANAVAMSNVVTLTTTGCAAGERMDIPFVSEADMTAGWSTTMSFITGGLLTYETVGTP